MLEVQPPFQRRAFGRQGVRRYAGARTASCALISFRRLCFGVDGARPRGPFEGAGGAGAAADRQALKRLSAMLDETERTALRLRGRLDALVLG